MADHYTILSKGKKPNMGLSKHFTNRKLLADFIGISYNTLTDHFVRKGYVWYYYEEQDITVIKVNSIEKGRQRVHRKSDGHNRNI